MWSSLAYLSGHFSSFSPSPTPLQEHWSSFCPWNAQSPISSYCLFTCCSLIHRFSMAYYLTSPRPLLKCHLFRKACTDFSFLISKISFYSFILHDLSSQHFSLPEILHNYLFTAVIINPISGGGFRKKKGQCSRSHPNQLNQNVSEWGLARLATKPCQVFLMCNQGSQSRIVFLKL